MWFWMCKHPHGMLTVSQPFDDFLDCYDAYVKAMCDLRELGADLVQMSWRGVFDAQGATEHMTAHMQGEL